MTSNKSHRKKLDILVSLVYGMYACMRRLTENVRYDNKELGMFEYMLKLAVMTVAAVSSVRNTTRLFG